MAGMETFKRGYILHCGNGAKINVWADPWLPNSPTRKVFTKQGRMLISKVEELIDPSTGNWDTDLVEDIFSLVDACRILDIPLSPCESKDIVAWHCTKNGVFSVKSVYHMEWEH
jgi:hypothetical protein